MTIMGTPERWRSAGAIALLAPLTQLAIAAPAASAPDADTELDALGRVHVRFRTVVAAGSGIAHQHGRFVQEGSLDAGALVVSAHAQAQIDGYDRRIRVGGHFLYLGARGRFRISGVEISSTVVGHDFRFDASGAGSVRFAGDGTSIINGRPPQPWS